jgi:nucleoside phosphorylase
LTLSVASTLLADQYLGQRPWLDELAAIITKIPEFYRPPSATDILHASDGTIVDHPEGSERNDQPVVHNGGIGTADTLQKNPNARDELRDNYRVKAIEMEAGGMQNAAWAHDRSIMVVRGICDYCDSFKNDAWQNYAAAAAAAFTKALILGMPSEWFPNV